MNDLLELVIDGAPKVRRWSVEGVLPSNETIYPPMVKEQVIRRDEYSCRFCGHVDKDNLCLSQWNENTMSSDGWVASCHHCFSARDLTMSANSRGGLIIWLPEVSQITISRLMNYVYMWRICQGNHGQLIRTILDKFVIEARNKANSIFGSSDIVDILDKLSAKEIDIGEAVLTGLRYLPLDRWIKSDSDADFNFYPQMLYNWRKASNKNYEFIENGSFLNACELLEIEMLKWPHSQTLIDGALFDLTGCRPSSYLSSVEDLKSYNQEALSLLQRWSSKDTISSIRTELIELLKGSQAGEARYGFALLALDLMIRNGLA